MVSMQYKPTVEEQYSDSEMLYKRWFRISNQ